MAFDVLAATEVRGAIRFAGANSVGPKVDITLPLVSFQPVLVDQPDHRRVGRLEVTGEVLLSAGSFGTVTHKEPA